MGNGNNYYLANAGDGSGWKIVAYDHNWAGSNCAYSECNPQLIYWSILHPTCRAWTGSNPLVGPFLNDNPDLQARYVEYIRQFVDEVMDNQEFIEEIMRHAETIRVDVADDPWSYGGRYFDDELSPDAASWRTGGGPGRFPLLPMYKARVESIREQLVAIENGRLSDAVYDPRGYCLDWRRGF